ncbi:hypothetical protein A9Q84_16860 [Halobacteriovorax marinus]|uniref:Uncharacterized protein n=1 Tax=Halobacteriovorax marinus TaxID=97084 RepID=A0A1Y5F4J9_9BACT|nr:hypothetical protein A9Q84_16860 [Halobacteriovorax marinus]
MHLKLLSIFILCSLVHAQPAKIQFNGKKVEVNKLCFDSGYVREIVDSNAHSAVAVVKRIQLNLGHQEVFDRNIVLQSSHRFYNRDSKKFEIAHIAECENKIVFNSTAIVAIEKNATTAEAIVYGNLKNHGINDIFNEKWKIYNNFETYLKRHGEKTRFSLEENFSEKISDVDFSSFSDWNDFSKKYMGGEQSGGGSGRVAVSLKYSSKALLRARKKKMHLDRIFNIDTTYENIILNKSILPRSKMFIKKDD